MICACRKAEVAVNLEGRMSAEKIFNEFKYSKYSWMDELKDNEKYFYYKAEVNTHWKELINSLRIYSRCPLAE